MKKQIAAVVAVVALASGVVQAALDNESVVIGPLPVTLSGTTTATDGTKTKLAPINMQYVQTEISLIQDGATNSFTRSLLGAISVTNVTVVVGESTNSIVIVVPIGTAKVYASELNQGVAITKPAKGTSGNATIAELVEAFSDISTINNTGAAFVADVKFKVGKSGAITGISSSVLGIWVADTTKIDGKLVSTK
ncbi:MAG: hypothetical protein WCS70_14120 [Verrucomicrobiota bacterium]